MSDRLRKPRVFVHIDPATGAFSRVSFTPEGRICADYDRARDNFTDSGQVVLEAYPIHEVQADGSQKEVWYVP